MATKTITITEEAYKRLAVKKEKNESFSDVINRITGKRSILELAGILSKKEGEEMKKHMMERRAEMRESINKKTEYMFK